MSLKEEFEKFEFDFIEKGLHRSLDMDEAVAEAFKAGYLSRTSMWLKEKTEKVSALMALEELTRPFPSYLSLDDLADENKIIREKYKLDDLPREDAK